MCYTGLMGTMYPLTRVMYAMGSDRVIFGFFSRVNNTLKTPHWATLFAGIFSGIMAAMFDFQELADMMSIGMKSSELCQTNPNYHSQALSWPMPWYRFQC